MIPIYIYLYILENRWEGWKMSIKCMASLVYFKFFDHILFVTYIIIITRCVRIANCPWWVYLKVENAKWTRRHDAKRINTRPSTTSGCRRADWSYKLCRCSLPTRRPRQLCIMGVSLCCPAKLCTRVLTHLFYIIF